MKSSYRTYRRCSRTSIDLMVSLNLQGNERSSDLSNCRGHDHHNHHHHQVPQASNEIYRPHQTPTQPHAAIRRSERRANRQGNLGTYPTLGNKIGGGGAGPPGGESRPR